MMACGTSLITLGFVLANERQFHPLTTGIVRGFTAVVMSYAVARYRNIDLSFPSAHNFRWQIIRNSIMTLQGLVYAWTLFHLPVPVVVTIYSATPIFTAIWDYWIFGVRINDIQRRWLAIAFIGVLLVTDG